MASFDDARYNLSYRVYTGTGDDAKTKTISYVNGGSSVGTLQGDAAIAQLYVDFATDAESLTGYTNISWVKQIAEKPINY